jgi:hypothetical protein
MAIQSALLAMRVTGKRDAESPAQVGVRDSRVEAPITFEPPWLSGQSHTDLLDSTQ